jgi:hypothetical protein
VVWTCDGDQVVVCDSTNGGYGITFEDCAPQGMHCGQANSNAACTDGNSCTQPANPHCDGSRVVGCDPGTLLEQSQDCSANGGTCDPISLGPFSSAACVGPGVTLCDDMTYQSHCDGNVEVFCLFGTVASIDCTVPYYDGTCVTSANGIACVPNANQCTAATPDACDGNDFLTCGTDQKLARVDCTSLGFRTCGDLGGRAGCIH